MIKQPAETQYRHFLAEIISWAFFPPLVATVFFVFLIFWYSADFSEGLKWVTYIAPFLIFLPLLFFAITYKLGWVDDLDLTNREDRPLYLVVFIFSLLAALALLFFLHAPLKFMVYTLSGLIMTIATTIITFYWKISFHTAVTTSVVTAITILGGLRFAPLLLLVPLIAWARLTLKKHTLWQVVGGFLVALAITEVVFYLFGFELFI
jgi:membrane-associated phospholipid phosphatase